MDSRLEIAGLRTDTVQSLGNGAHADATVVPFDAGRRERPPRATRPAATWAAVLLGIVLAFSPFDSGYFNFTSWGPLALAAMVLLVIVVRVCEPAFTRVGVAASIGLGSLVALSAASMLWAESKDSAWTSTNRVAFYAVIFAIVVLAVRERGGARAIVIALGAPALIACVWLDAMIAVGHGQGSFLLGRLNDPIGYVNGMAALLVMGCWPWLACAEAAQQRRWRSAALGAATLIVGTCVLTQSRSLIPALALSAGLTIWCAGERRRRVANLAILLAAVACTLPWTLAVYPGAAAATNTSPTTAHLVAAGIALIVAAIGAAFLREWGSRLLEPRGGLASIRVPRVSKRALAGAAIVILAVGIPLSSPLISRQWHNFTSLQVNQTTTDRFVDIGGFRYDLWRVALKEFSAHPVAGLGAGNYDAEYYLLRRNPSYVQQPHSLELQDLAELGVLGFAALALFCVAVLSAAFKRSGTLAAQDGLVKVGALGIFSAWLVYTSVDWPYDIPGIAGMAFVAAGLLVVPAARRAVADPARRRRSRLWSVPALIVIALLAASIGRQYVATRVSQSGLAQVSTQPARAVKTLRLAAQLDPYSLNTLIWLASAYARLDSYQDARDALLVAAAREPTNYVPPALLGDLAMRRGYYAVAVSEYRAAIALDPDDPTLQSSLSSALGAAR
jgi:O-antigen ligase